MKEYGAGFQVIAGSIKLLEVTKPNLEGGSTDFLGVVYIVSKITLHAAAAPYKSPWHS